MKITVDSYKNYEFKTRVIVEIGRGTHNLTREQAEDLHAALAAVLASDAAFPESNIPINVVGKGFPQEGST